MVDTTQRTECGSQRLADSVKRTQPAATYLRIAEVTNIFERDRTFAQPINWVTTLFMAAFHVGAIAALFFFTWKGLALAAVFWWMSGSLGIGMGYHRLLTHRGYKTPKWLRSE